MEKRNVLKNQKGFTLVEIIAVLVILGILAAVAVPKFVDLQTESRNRALLGALAAVKSQAVMDFASAVLTDPTEATNWTVTQGATRSYGDFNGSYTNSTGTVTVAIIAGEPTWNTGSTAQFSIY